MAFSRIIIGTMKWGSWGKQLSTSEMQQLIEGSIAVGLTTFDHADIYGDYTTEAEFGAVLKQAPQLREQMQLITKCGIKLPPTHPVKSYDTSKAYILQQVDQSLKNLHTDQIDLLLIHRPSPLMDPEEVAEAFLELRDTGKVVQFGVSNFTPRQVDMLMQYFPVEANQVRGSAMHLDPFLDGTFDQCLQHGMLAMVWSPLGGGSFFTDLENPRVKRIRGVLEGLCEQYETTVDQLLLVWLLHHPASIYPVLGTGRLGRILSAAETVQIQLTDEEWFRIWEASTGEPVP